MRVLQDAFKLPLAQRHAQLTSMLQRSPDLHANISL